MIEEKELQDNTSIVTEYDTPSQSTIAEAGPQPESAIVDAQAVAQPESLQQRRDESPQGMRIKTLRQLKEKAERERDEAVALLNKQQQTSLDTARDMQQLQPQQSSDEFDIAIAPDEIAEGKHISKMSNEIKALRKQLNEHKQNSTLMTAEATLKIKYPDIDSIVSKENMEILSIQYPEIYATVQSSPDFYNKAAAAYTMIKKLGIHVDDPYQEDKEIAQRNAAKPRPTSSIGAQRESALSNANAFAHGLTPELKSQLYKEMMDMRKNF